MHPFFIIFVHVCDIDKGQCIWRPMENYHKLIEPNNEQNSFYTLLSDTGENIEHKKNVMGAR